MFCWTFFEEHCSSILHAAHEDILRTHDFCTELAVIAAQWFLTEMHDETKVTHHYLESINSKYSLAMTMISEEERQAGMGIEASNITSPTPSSMHHPLIL
jgi:hypothetical protein